MVNNDLTKTIFYLQLSLLSTCISLGQAWKGVSSETAPHALAKVEQTTSESRSGFPTVVCNGTQLTISTNNSTLASVLAEVHKCIGAKIDVPDGAITSRLFDQLGPGPAPEVLSSLLAATGYDYVIGLSESNPDKVETILLMTRSIDTSPGARPDSAQSPGRRAFLQMRQNGRSGTLPTESNLPDAPSESDTETKNPTTSTSNDAPAVNMNQPQSGDQRPAVADGGLASRDSSNPIQTNTSSSSAQSSDTHEQITDMEKLFEQRRQMMLNQNAQSPK